MAVYVQTNKVLQLAGADAILESNNGNLIVTPQAAPAAVIYTLPTLALGAGTHYHIVCAASPTVGIITFTCPANTIKGLVTIAGIGTVSDFLVVPPNTTSVNFALNAAITGDYLDLYCDGTSYFVSGMTRAVAGITFA